MNSLDEIVGSPLNIPKVVDADYLGAHRLDILFSDGKRGIVDFAKLLNKPFFAHLKNKTEFIQYGLEYGTIVWANGVDVSPEYLYSEIKR